MDAWLVILLVGAVICAVQAIRAARLLAAAIWLAGVSAFVAIALYVMGAQQVAVIELSVGAGLVTVLFVFAISIAGEEAMEVGSIIPRPVAWVLVGIAAVLLALMTLPALGVELPVVEDSFAEMLWQERGLDVLVQIVLIFAGVLGVLGLLGDTMVVTDEITVVDAAVQDGPESEDADPSTTLKEMRA